MLLVLNKVPGGAEVGKSTRDDKPEVEGESMHPPGNLFRKVQVLNLVLSFHDGQGMLMTSLSFKGWGCQAQLTKWKWARFWKEEGVKIREQ